MTSNNSLASIIISSYNYGRFLPDAIESALNQTYQPTEVIVVDDGSTDDSRSIIADYGEQIIALCKDNGGTASVHNAGFALSQGEFICFLDSDDILLPTALERAIEHMDDPNVVNVQWQLCEIDNEGKSLEKLIPEKLPPQGDLLPLLIEKGPEAYHFPPTSGNLWSRNYLAQIFPIPEAQASDAYRMLLAPLFGKIKSLPDYQTLKRVHDQNQLRQLSYSKVLKRQHFRATLLQEYLQKQGINLSDPSKQWKSSSSQHVQQMIQIANELELFIPAGHQYILVDLNQWGPYQLLEKATSIPFLEKNGLYWGLSPDSETAIEELRRSRRNGASFIVFGQPAFWYFDHYTEFNRYLRTQFPCLLDSDRLVVFDLR